MHVKEIYVIFIHSFDSGKGGGWILFVDFTVK